jgi:NSS family neurotransmitter:Na+ symporter
MTVSREQFGSRLGFILAAAGSAVGIGNLVGFPVAATKGGGAAFFLLYVIFIIFICLPVMIAELSLGRRTQKDPIGAYIKETGAKSPWRILGGLSFITPFMIAVFYTVITVWIFGYFFEIAQGNLLELGKPETFNKFVNSNQVFVHLFIVTAFVNLILISGVNKGIERAAKIMMPSLFIMLIGLVVFVLTLDNAQVGLRYYLVPDFSKMNTSVINSALSQAFFSLSLGMGILITYGSYVSKSESITSSAKLIAVADTTVAFFAGLLILPAIFVINPKTDPAQLSDSSVAMIFTYLPKLFLALQPIIGYVAASVVALVFFLLVFFAAITSLVSIIEVPTSSLIDTLKLKRKRALVQLVLPLSALSVLCICSLGMIDGLTHFVSYAGMSKSFFDVIVDVFYDTVLPLNGLLICLFVRFRWKKTMDHELVQGDSSYNKSLAKRYVDFSVVTFIPLILLLVFINTVLQKFVGINIF